MLLTVQDAFQHESDDGYYIHRSAVLLHRVRGARMSMFSAREVIIRSLKRYCRIVLLVRALGVIVFPMFQEEYLEIETNPSYSSAAIPKTVRRYNITKLLGEIYLH